MGTVLLGWSEDRFWDCSLRELIAFRDQREKEEKRKARTIGYMVACFMNGQDPDEVVVDEKTLRAQEYAMGNAMW